MIEVAGVSHAYGDRRVLVDVTVSLAERRVAVIGANGSGKSTFARLLNGLVVPDTGTVRVGGHDTRSHARDVRRLVGFCFTNPDAQIVMPTVREDIAFGLRRHRLAQAEVDRRVDEALERFELTGHADHPAHLLSGGQKQLLALASVLVTQPSILVMDEPTTLLDLRNTLAVAAYLQALDQQVVLVTHDLQLAAAYERVLVFDEGRLVHDGGPVDAIGHYRALLEATHE